MDENTQAEMPAPDAITPETEVADSSPAVEVETQPDDTGQPEEAKKPSWAQKRIDELTRNWREEQRRSAELLGYLQSQHKPEPKAEEPTKLPTLEEMGYDEAKYQAALIQHATKHAEAIVERRLTEADQKRVEQARLETFATRQREFAKATPDFEDKVMRDSSLPITPAMRDVILDSPAGPEVAYYLAENRAIAEQIAALPPHLAALEMGRIEGRLSYQKAAKTKPVPVVSKAPPPTPIVDATESDAGYIRASDPDSDKLDMRDWMKRREKEVRKKQR